VSTAGAPAGFADWLVSVVPTNPIAAAAEGNLLSLLVFVMVLAVAVARSPRESREPVATFFTAFGDVLLLVVRWVIALAPVGVFALVLPLAARSGSLLAGAVGFYIAAFAATCAVATALCYPLVGAFTGFGVRSFARQVLPAQLIGVSCSSSIASLPAMVRSAEGLGIPSRVSGFTLPVAVSLFKPAAPVAWLVGVHFVAHFFGVTLGTRELLIVAAASVSLSFAAPGVPRGAFLLLTPLFTTIGLPPEGIGLLIAVDAIPDACATVVNVTGDLTATALVAGRTPRSSPSS
jgi:Na+/H+-dicarboxylate symporter